MTEGPISTPSRFIKYPLKRLFFITVKDNSQKTKWVSIGKVNDWVRKYSTTYNIVRGTNGGNHFHMLVGTRVDAKPFRFPKGIHFHVQNVLAEKPIPYCEDTLSQLCESKRMRELIYDDLISKYHVSLSAWQQDALRQICYSIHHRAGIAAARVNQVRRQTKKERSIQRVLDYLDQNVNEPRPREIGVYRDYIRRGC